MPQFWWSDNVRKSNGYFGCEATREGEKVTDSWVFFESKQLHEDMEYDWSKINVFSRWLCSTKQTGILLFDRKEDTRSPLVNKDPPSALLSDPFWVYPYLLEEVAALEERSVWSIRDKVRAIEKSDEGRKSPERKPQPDYRTLHNIARHAIHVTETLDVAIQTMDHILKHHGIHASASHTSLLGSKTDPQVRQEVHSRLSFFQSFLGSLKHRSVSNEKRLQNEIQLAFNTVAQHDAAVTVKISSAMMSDSAALKTLAFVTFVFLPPTFICAVFSMSFFNYSDSGWRVSSKIWIYWAFAVPTTIISAFVWGYWHKVSPMDTNEKIGTTMKLRDMA
ncbi:hypothetical protein N7462_011519 [Penicillium macrosclerotiorum]|uniref:uncharacterized protein n=1 Tax=Penicillium macrosclerotiorum TaxID=303699 RepID=UPI00254986AF|nr:uncharacterized protein N7462_011519 [Penicillium macrosclerotiorum]KAJ5664706.1 hypothetical protein N7462_011519 [Penicillium macrosclerotiorum]